MSRQSNTDTNTNKSSLQNGLYSSLKIENQQIHTPNGLTKRIIKHRTETTTLQHHHPSLPTRTKQPPQPSPSSSSQRSPFPINLIITIPILLTFLLFLKGIHLQSQFINGSICTMTYSHYQYLPIILPSLLPHRYRFLKFTDERDPRHTSLHLRFNPNHDREYHPISLKEWNHWCSSSSNQAEPTLYVHGHWGCHAQSRSLGAHGTTMTGARQFTRKLESMLRMGEMNRDESSGLFLYDVYVLDFDGGEGGALHGYTLEMQARAVQYAVEAIAEACSVPSVTIVAHSIGGIVARAAALMLQHQWDATPTTSSISSPRIDTIVTLASPHIGLPHAHFLDPTVHRFYSKVNTLYRQRNEQRRLPLLISISGGWRDELIPPDWCDVEELYRGGVSVLASDIVKPSSSSDEESMMMMAPSVWGMDHKAIVWCHSILSVVRHLVDVTSKAEFRNKTLGHQTELIRKELGMLKGGRGDDAPFRRGQYEKRWKEEERLLRESLGGVFTSALQATLPYNLQLLPTFYTIIALFHLIDVPRALLTSTILLLGLTSISNLRISFGVVWILTAMAQLLYFGVYGILRFLVGNGIPKSSFRKIVGVSLGAFTFLPPIVLLWWRTTTTNNVPVWDFGSVVFCWILLGVFLTLAFGSSPYRQPKHAGLGLLVLVLCFGKCLYSYNRFFRDQTMYDNDGLIPFGAFVVLPLIAYLRLENHNTVKEQLKKEDANAKQQQIPPPNTVKTKGIITTILQSGMIALWGMAILRGVCHDLGMMISSVCFVRVIVGNIGWLVGIR